MDTCKACLRDYKNKSYFSFALFLLYRFIKIRPFVTKLYKKLENGEFYSYTLRKIFNHYHKVTIGQYSYGEIFKPGVLPAGTVVGRYCSVADDLKIFRRNHPANYISQHPFFYNNQSGFVAKDTILHISDNPLYIGNDVWIGSRVLVLPSCKYIGDGAIVGAGSVVTRSVEPYTIVAGNPAKFIKFRFSDDVKQLIIDSHWWELSISELNGFSELFTKEVIKEKLGISLYEKLRDRK